MNAYAKFLASIFGMICLYISNHTHAQLPNEVYRNELIGTIIRYEGSEGGFDWAFTKALPEHVVSFDYKGTQVTLKGLTGQRFIRKDHPLPAGFKLQHAQVLIDGYPATNYNNYMTYYNTLYEAINKIGKEVDRNNKQHLQEQIKIIDYKIAEIRKQSEGYQVSPRFRDQHNFDGYIKNLESLRKSFQADMAQIDKKKESSTIVITGGGSNKDHQARLNKSSNDNLQPDLPAGNTTGSSSTNKTTANTKQDDNIRTSAQFKGGLDDIKEGDYFKDDKGNYYHKENGAAHKADKAAYDRHAANKIYKQMELKEIERQQRDAAFKQNWDNVSTSFYAMSMAKEGLRDASSLGSGFSNIEELNAAYRQKLRQISAMGSQMQAASTQGAQAYTNIVGRGANGYDYSGALGAIGGIAAAIGANKAEKDAREELKRQRAAEEAKIKEAQFKALTAIRTEIGKMFTEGGMPLSTHKITAPVLYVFAYSSKKAEWNKNQNIPMSISNVIPVYRYSDGTYPYTSNVKRTFESAGIENPVLIGYFTHQAEAENYRSSLLDVAPNAKFTVNEVEVKVKEQTGNTANNSSDVDFWGTKTEAKKQISTQNTETDFWGTPTKEKKAEAKKTEAKKEVDFWGK